MTRGRIPSRHHIVRAAAGALVLLLMAQVPFQAEPRVGRGCAHADDGPSAAYESMTVEQLAAAAEKLESDFNLLDQQAHEEVSRLYGERNNRFAAEKSEVMAQISDLQEAAKAKQLAAEQVRSDATREQRQPTRQEVERLKTLEVELSRSKGNIASLEQRFQKIAAEHAKFEAGTVPQVEALKARVNAAGKQMFDAVQKITEVGVRRFPKSPYFHRLGVRTQVVRTGKGKVDLGANTVVPPVDGTLNDADFLRQLNEPIVQKHAIKLPTELYRVGMPTHAELGELDGVKQLNLFKEWGDAQDFLEGRYRGADKRIYRIETAELVKTKDGRQALLQIASDLLADRDRADFRVPMPDAEGYERAILERVEPRPTFLSESAPPTPEPPPESILEIVEPDANSPEGKRQRTLDLARRQQVATSLPDLEGANHREALIRPEEAGIEIGKIFDAQKTSAFEDVLRGETSPELRAEAAAALDTLAEAHTPKAGSACIEQGKATFNAQTQAVRTRISRGRFLAEMWNEGLQGIKESAGPWHNKGLNQLFLSVAIWDIGYTLVQDGLTPAAEKAGALVCISLTLSALAKRGAAEGATRLAIAGMVGAELAVIGLTVYGLYDIWDRFMNRFPAYMADLTYTDQILGTKPWTLVDPRGNPQADVAIGFLTHKASPAYGLSRDSWFLRYRSDTELIQAIGVYFDALERFFGDAARMPPHYDRDQNYARYSKTIIGEWAAKHSAVLEALRAEFEERRQKQLAQEANLPYTLATDPNPAPTGAILALKMTPEVPKLSDREIKIVAYQAVAGLPGDKVTARTRFELIKNDKPAGAAPPEDKRVELGVGEAYRVLRTETTLRLSGPGDYVYRHTLHLDPLGTDPAPKEIRFAILGEEEPPPPAVVGVRLTSSGADKLNETSTMYPMFVAMRFEPIPEGLDAEASKPVWAARHALGQEIDGKWLVLRVQAKGHTRYAFTQVRYYRGEEKFADVQLGGIPFIAGEHEIVATTTLRGKTYSVTDRVKGLPFPEHEEALKRRLAELPGVIEEKQKELDKEAGPGGRPELADSLRKFLAGYHVSYGQALIESGDYARGIALVDQHFPGMHPTYQPQIASDMATIAALSGDGTRLLSYRRLNPDVNLVWVANQYAMTTGDLATARALAREGQQAGRTDAPMFPMTDDELAK